MLTHSICPPTSRMPADCFSLKGMLITALAKASWELHSLWDLHRPPNSMKSSGRKYHYPLCLSSRYRSESHSEDRAFSIIARGPAAAEATFYQHWYSVKVLQKNSYIIPRTIIRVNPLAVYSWCLPKIRCGIYAISQQTSITSCVSSI